VRDTGSWQHWIIHTPWTGATPAAAAAAAVPDPPLLPSCVFVAQYLSQPVLESCHAEGRSADFTSRDMSHLGAASDIFFPCWWVPGGALCPVQYSYCSPECCCCCCFCVYLVARPIAGQWQFEDRGNHAWWRQVSLHDAHQRVLLWQQQQQQQHQHHWQQHFRYASLCTYWRWVPAATCDTRTGDYQHAGWQQHAAIW